jgi:inositol-hexakisphosphate/diphosphoinositol-pentakisphosphate 1-kinase
MKLKIKTSEPRFIALFKDQNKDELKLKDAFNLTKVLEMTIEIIAQMDPKDSAIKDFLQMKLVLEAGGHFDGLTRKLQLKVLDRDSSDNGKGQIKKIMLVLKWGGDLSFLGYEDAIELGRKMRTERYDDKDCLSLYSSYRHDLKTYASDEGRCIKTAAAFLKGFLSI